LTVALPPIFKNLFTETKAAFEREHKGTKIEGKIGVIDAILEGLTWGRIKADVYMAIGRADLSQLERAGLVEPGGGRVFAKTRLVAVVQRGNPKGLKSLEGLASAKVGSFALADPKLNACGRAFVEAMKRKGLWSRIEPKTKVFASVRRAVRQVEERRADASVTYFPCYYFGLRRTTDLLAEIPSDLHPPIECTAVILKGSKNPDLARAFVEFLLSEEAQDAVERWGFERVTPRPKGVAGRRELLVLSGAGLRPAMDAIAEAYERRYGVRVRMSYAGAGVLLAQLSFSKRGDIYVPGELFYAEQAKRRGLVVDWKVACYFVPVIAVQKGNPKGIRTLADLGRPGVRVGLGDPKAMPAGIIAERILKRAGVWERVKRNVVMRAGAIPTLGNALSLRTIDASIIWDAVARQFSEHVDVIPIPPKFNELVIVPVAVTKFAKDPEEARRFVEFATSEEGKRIFEEKGFTVRPPKGLPRRLPKGGPRRPREG